MLIHEYADNVYSSLFCGLGDRNWLSQADFLLCVDAGVKDLFPSHLFMNVPQQVFETTVLAASDRAFDEQRFLSFRWDTIQQIIVGKGTQKKIREALDTSRQRVIKEDIEQIEHFVRVWVSHFVKILAATTQGDPTSLVELDTVVELFQVLVQEGGLPLKMTVESGVPPPGWPVVKDLMTQAFKTQYGLAPPGGGKTVNVFDKGHKGGIPPVPPAPVRPTSSTASSSWNVDIGSEPDGSTGFQTRTPDAWFPGGNAAWHAGDDPDHMRGGHAWSQGSWDDSAEEPPAKRLKGRWQSGAN